MTTAIRKHLRDFLAILALIALSLLVGGYILGQQRLAVPGWVPVLGKDVYVLKGELSSAQAVTPGQGQTVDVAGVEVGQVTDVSLKGGRAVVTMELDRDKTSVKVYRDASLLLRPKTGLRDMVVELTPGTPRAGRMPDGGTVPIGRTLPDVNADEILAALDDDTRQFLTLLLGGTGEGLRGNAGQLAQDLRRFEPLERRLREVNEQLAKRRENVRQVVHNLSLVSDELGGRDDQIAKLVGSSDQVFATLAQQDQSLRAALRELPPTLRETRTGLAKAETLARTLRPAAERLRPTARALGPALRQTRPFLRTTTPIVRDELRPFARAALPTVRELRPTLRDLRAATPDLQRSVNVVNALLNTLAYNPPGAKEEGYLFWLSWANHLASSVFSTQDAHGPIRRGILVLSCSSLGLLDNVAQVNPTLGVLIGLLNAPRQAQVCPGQAGAQP